MRCSSDLNTVVCHEVPGIITMGQFSQALLAIDNAHTVPQRALDCRLGLAGLNEVNGPTIPLPLLRVNVGQIRVKRLDGVK